MALQIPERDRQKLIQFARLSSAQFEELYQAVEAAEPALRLSTFTAHVLERISPEHRGPMADLVRFLVTLYWVSVDENVAQDVMALEVARNAAAAGVELSSEGWETLKRYVERFLALDKTLGVASKAAFVAGQYPSHFHSSRVLTDARPIFGADPEQVPFSFILSHTLALRVHTDDEDRELYITLDRDDLVALKASIERAITKESSLTAVLSKTGIPVLGWE